MLIETRIFIKTYNSHATINTNLYCYYLKIWSSKLKVIATNDQTLNKKNLLTLYGNAIYVFLPGASCVVICICINVIRLTHPFDYSDKHQHMVIGVWIVRILCIIVMIGILNCWEIANHFVILGVYVLCFIIQIVVDFEAKTRLIITKTVDKNKSLHFYRTPKGTMPLNAHKDDQSGDKIEYTVTTKELVLSVPFECV